MTKKCDLTDETTLDQFISLCELQCTSLEVAGFFRVSRETLRTRIKEAFGEKESWETVFEQYSVGGKISLRRTQFKLAQKSAALAIFLGKNYLNQVDVKTLDDVNKPINITWTDAKAPENSVDIKVAANKNAEKTQ